MAPEQVPLRFDPPGLLAGVDEAGRGPLAGPVVAAAVVIARRKSRRACCSLKSARMCVLRQLHFGPL